MKNHLHFKIYIGFFLLLFTCKTTNYKNLELKLNASSDSIAVYTIQEKDLSSILPAPISNAGTLIEKEIDLTPYLTLVSYKKNLLSSENWETLFKDEEIEEINLLLSKAIQRQPGYAFLVLIRKEDPLSPLLKILRTSLLILKTENGFLFAIPDLNQNLTFVTQYKFDDWALYQIPKLRSSKKQELKIKPNQINFSIYKELVGEETRFFDRIWIAGDKRFLPNPLLFKTPDTDDLPPPDQKKSVMDRMKTLDELRKNGMIDEEEYKTKKAEILKDL